MIGKQYIHTIAEATKNLNLADPHNSVGDDTLLGCTIVDKKGRLCEYTIEAPATISCPTRQEGRDGVWGVWSGLYEGFVS